MTPSKLVEDINFKLGNVSDDIFFDMKVTQIQTLLVNIRSTLLPAIHTTRTLDTPETVSSLTPEMECIRSVALSGEVMTCMVNLS